MSARRQLGKRPKHVGDWEPSGAMLALVARAGEAYDLSVKEVRGKDRSRRHVRARQAAVWALRVLRSDLAYPQVAWCVGFTDHSTAVYSWKQAVIHRARDPHFFATCQALVENGPLSGPFTPPMDAAALARIEERAAWTRERSGARGTEAQERDEQIGRNASLSIAGGSAKLLEAIRREHPERFADGGAA